MLLLLLSVMNFSSQSLRLLLKLEIWEFKMQIEDCSKQQEADIVLIVLLCVVIEIMFCAFLFSGVLFVCRSCARFRFFPTDVFLYNRPIG